MSSRDRVYKIAIFEYGSHNRQAISIATTISSVVPNSNITLFYRNDWYKFDSKIFATKKIPNEYIMLLTQLFYTLLGYQIVVSTTPEACRSHVKLLFNMIAFFEPYKSKRVVCLRDIKRERGESIHRFLTKYTSDSIAVENRSIAHACSEAGLRVDAVHPTSTHRDRPRPSGRGDLTEVANIVLLGSLDTERRNYDIPVEAFETLHNQGLKLKIRIGGQCQVGDRSKFVWRRLQMIDNTLEARATLLDHELDQLLLDADVIICCNRREYYGSMKPSGTLGDTILSGLVCLAPVELAPSFKKDESLFDYYTDDRDLCNKMLTTINSKMPNLLPESLVASYVLAFEKLFVSNN